MKTQKKNLLPYFFIGTLILIAILFFKSVINIFLLNDPSIAWSDSFEDKQLNGWAQNPSENNFYIKNGSLIAGPDKGGEISHESYVSSGTWSFDLFFPDDEPLHYKDYRICYICSENFSVGLGFETFSIVDYTAIYLNTIHELVVTTGERVQLGRRLAGWEYFDVTRDELGNSRIYINGELIIEFQDGLNISPHWFTIQSPAVGPALDDVVVRNEVIEIQPKK